MGALGSGRRPAGEKPALRLLPSKQMAALPGMTPDARRHWNRILRSLPVDYFSPTDGALLMELCEAAALHDRAVAILAKDGPVIPGYDGKTPMAHPAVSIAKGAAATVAMLSTKLRLAKSSRTPRDAATTQLNKPRGTLTKKPWEKNF